MTKPREKNREELQAEIEDGKKKIRQLENREKVLRQKLSQEERRTRSHRLIVRGAVFESIVPEAKTMTDEEVKAEIDKLCETYNVSLNDSQKNQLVSLCRSLEKLDTDELKDKLVGIAKTVDNAGKIGQTVSKIGESIKSFFASVGNFFTRLFGGNK